MWCAPGPAARQARLDVAMAQAQGSEHGIALARRLVEAAEAIRRGRMIDEEGGVLWIEEPIRADDFAGCAKVAREVATPIQIGENFMGPEQMAQALAAGACDVTVSNQYYYARLARSEKAEDKAIAALRNHRAGHRRKGHRLDPALRRQDPRWLAGHRQRLQGLRRHHHLHQGLRRQPLHIHQRQQRSRDRHLAGRKLPDVRHPSL